MSRHNTESMAGRAFNGEDYNDNIVYARRLQARAMGDALGKAARATVRFVFGTGQRA